MLMAVMEVRIVWMLVAHGLVPMRMRMRLCHRPVMRMLVMRIMHVAVLVLNRLMNMLMVMAFGKVKPNTDRHEDCGECKRSS
jgi:hypothetical protein